MDLRHCEYCDFSTDLEAVYLDHIEVNHLDENKNGVNSLKISEVRTLLNQGEDSTDILKRNALYAKYHVKIKRLPESVLDLIPSYQTSSKKFGTFWGSWKNVPKINVDMDDFFQPWNNSGKTQRLFESFEVRQFNKKADKSNAVKCVKKYKCRFCKFKTINKTLMKNHAFKAHEVALLESEAVFDRSYCRYHCKYCTQSHSRLSKAKQHHFLSHVKKCPFCEAQVRTEKGRRFHLIKMHEENCCHRCEYYGSKSSLNEHVSQMHSSVSIPEEYSELQPEETQVEDLLMAEDIVYNCLDCDFETAWKYDLSVHMSLEHATPDGNISSFSCYQTFSGTFDILECLHCELMSSSKQNLKIHHDNWHSESCSGKPTRKELLGSPSFEDNDVMDLY